MAIPSDPPDPASVETGALSPLQIEVVRKLLPIARAGKWAIGDKISDAALAREFGISRTPIRQVLQFLVEKGLLAQTDTRGFVLVRIPADDDRLEELVPPSSVETLYRQIMHARANGLIGSEASETELLDHFGTSRGVVRRTLMRLSAEGLAERRDGHGWRFAECLDNRQAVNESYAFRAIIECGAVMEDTFRFDMGVLLALESEQTALLNAPLASIEGSAWFEANARFHETVVSWANNRFLDQAIRRQNSLRRMTEYAEFAELNEAGVRKAARDHLAILEAIKSDDRKLASAILFRHLSRSSASGEARPARMTD
ncbi:GntR family transcriptional regulator [Rhizobium sp. SSA_523]|uniref:GntR family transcriptional regulator n=1 Tax=Rhizobium sp. SSA_523 TaxID=2952477 RepID=UPI002091DE0D|nr:GntR family transcriptional regulator [Rhizobium sp. SSA_523]MCO5731573.1 GntR family transcriptional regulator [Rhizobium sp. SSA_523]WKC21912.1 GntR family transcriptional regulator [Rhizobium sp. SSA_523]